MPKVEDIEYTTSLGTFLKDSEISTLENSFRKKSLKNVDNDMVSQLNSEMSASGLSIESLNIGGRAPLNELGKELVNRVTVTITDIENLSNLVREEGNKHRQEEAKRFYDKCDEEYHKRYNALKTAINSYNNYNDANDDKSVRKKNSEGEWYTDHVTKDYGDCGISPDSYDVNQCVKWNPKPNYTSPKAGDVQKAFDSAREMHVNYVQKAIDLQKECAGLSTSGAAYKIASTDGKDLPAGVKEGASVKVEKLAGGGTKTVYTNPDGSIVEVEKFGQGEGAPKTVTNKNRYGYITEKTKYNTSGKVIEKTKYSYEKTEVDHVYKATPTTYKVDENGKETKIETGEPTLVWKGQKVNIVDQSDLNTDPHKAALDSMEKGEPFVLKKGTTLVDDRAGANGVFSAKDKDMFFVKGEDGKYYEADKNGNIRYSIDPKSVDPRYIDKDNFAKGSESGADVFANNSRVESTKKSIPEDPKVTAAKNSPKLNIKTGEAPEDPKVTAVKNAPKLNIKTGEAPEDPKITALKKHQEEWGKTKEDISAQMYNAPEDPKITIAKEQAAERAATVEQKELDRQIARSNK